MQHCHEGGHWERECPSKHLEDKLIKYEWKLVEYKAWNKHASTHVINLETTNLTSIKGNDIEKEIQMKLLHML
jgi:hypothetical protein